MMADMDRQIEAIRGLQKHLPSDGWEPRINGEFYRGSDGAWLGFTFSMGQVLISIWKRGKEGITQTRYGRVVGPTTDPLDVELIQQEIAPDSVYPPVGWEVRR